MGDQGAGDVIAKISIVFVRNAQMSFARGRPPFLVNKRLAKESHAVSAQDSPETQSNPASSTLHGSAGVSGDVVDLENIDSQAIDLSGSHVLELGASNGSLPPEKHVSSTQSLSRGGISPETTLSVRSYSPLLTLDDLHARHLTRGEQHTQTFEPVYPNNSFESFRPSIESPLIPFALPAERIPPAALPNTDSSQPLQAIKEACLFRYYIEELAHWFDTCDPLRHFQFAVPQRARGCQPLLNAIFAVSARHLARVPRYKTSEGIRYYGQLFPDLTLYTGVEYLLKCIPFLRNFHTIQDEEYQENLMAATVILRQYEEIEEGEEEEEEGGTIEGNNLFSNTRTHVDEQVNFLAITQQIIRIAKSSPTSRSLANASFLISVRQEVYCAFVRERAPQIHVDRGSWEGMSVANKTVLHAAEVMKWRWGDRTKSEWFRLKEQHHQLVQASAQDFVPILERKADKTKREVYPTRWFSSDAEVVGAQHLDLARIVLIAENPNLETVPRALAARRQAEAQVRVLVLNICGIGICHPRSPPALVSAALAIMTYGDYFTDASERRALEDVIEKTRSYCAWPARKAVQRLHLGWELSDGNDDLMKDIC